MTGKRSDRDSASTAPQKAKQEQSRSGSMESEEEKVLRIKRGWRAPDGLELDWEGQGHPDTLAKLRAMEQRAFAASGRIDELRREAGASANPTKDKIVARLGGTDEPAEAEETAEATASSDKKGR